MIDCNKRIIYGKEKAEEYNEVAKEVERTFREWISFAGLNIEEFDMRMRVEPHLIRTEVNSDGDIEIYVLAGNKQVITPLIFKGEKGEGVDRFIIDVLFLFTYIASRYESKSFEKAVTNFASKMVEEKVIEF